MYVGIQTIISSFYRDGILVRLIKKTGIWDTLKTRVSRNCKKWKFKLIYPFQFLVILLITCSDVNP